MKTLLAGVLVSTLKGCFGCHARHSGILLPATRRPLFFPYSAVRRPRLSADETCLVVLSYLGSQSSTHSLANRFDISKSSVHKCTQYLLNFLSGISEVISWPDSHEQGRIKTSFLLRSKGSFSPPFSMPQLRQLSASEALNHVGTVLALPPTKVQENAG